MGGNTLFAIINNLDYNLGSNMTQGTLTIGLSSSPIAVAIWTITIWLCNIAIENDLFIDDKHDDGPT